MLLGTIQPVASVESSRFQKMALCGSGFASYTSPDDIQIIGISPFPDHLRWSPRQILADYLRDPDSFAPLLDDNLSIILWNPSQRHLMLARAPLSSPRLFYTVHNHCVTFSDSPRLILHQRGMSPAIDEDGVKNWLASHPFQDEHSTFLQISRVLPGTAVSLRDGRVTTHSTWFPLRQSELKLRDEREYVEGIQEHLQRAITSRLHDNVTWGAELSGGLDSSVVTTVAAKALSNHGRSLHAYTGVPDDSNLMSSQWRFNNEGLLAADTARMYPNIRHTLSAYTERPFLQVADRWSDAEEFPTLNPNHLAWVEAIYEAARQDGIQAMLGGWSGNYSISYNGRFALTDLVRQRRYVDAIKLASAYHKREYAGFSSARSLLRMMLSGVSPAFGTYFHRRRIQTEITLPLPVRPEFVQSSPHPSIGPLRDFENSRSERLFCFNRMDRATPFRGTHTLYGLTCIDPTADRELVEFCLSIPEEFYTCNGMPRSLIRSAMAEYLPNSVRLEARTGMQGAANLEFIVRQQGEFAEEFRRMKEFPLLTHIFDLDQLIDRTTWAKERIVQSGWATYVNQMVRCASVGRFIRRTQEHTLFDTLPAIGKSLIEVS